MKNLLALAVLLAPPQEPSPFEFQVHEMGAWGTTLAQTSLVDIDRDGDLDFVSGHRAGPPEVAWWEYRLPGTWERHLIGRGFNTDCGGVAFDVDGDGWTDQVSGNLWFRNPGRAGAAWESFDIGVVNCHDLKAADLDGDGRLDLVALSDHQKQVRWFRNPPDPRLRWPASGFGTTVHNGLALGDIDKDGDIDVLRAKVWYENRDGRGGEWAEHRVPYGGKNDVQAELADLDGDGDLDMVESDHMENGGRVAWIENRDGKGLDLAERVLGTGLGILHSVVPADFDGDGDVDVYAGHEQGTSWIWENRRGAFVQHLIARNVPGHETRAGDVDGDGDIDLCSKPWTARDGKGRHVYLRNMRAERKGFPPPAAAAAPPPVAPVFAGAVAAPPPPAAARPPTRGVPGVLGYWRLDEGHGTAVADASGHGHGGSVRGAASWSTDAAPTPFAVVNPYCLELDGAGYVRIDDVPAFDAIKSAITIAAWVRRKEDQKGWRAVVSRQIGTGGGEHYGLYFGENVLNFLGNTGPGKGVYVANSAGRSPNGRWIHIAATYDGETVRLYVDGQEAASQAWKGTFAEDDNPILLGGNENDSSDDAQELFAGRIDDVRLYSVCLSPEQVRALAGR